MSSSTYIHTQALPYISIYIHARARARPHTHTHTYKNEGYELKFI